MRGTDLRLSTQKSHAEDGNQCAMSRTDENGFLNGSIANWIVGHRDQHAATFAAIRELNRECHRFLEGRESDITSELHTTATVLFMRLMELFQGVFIVVEHGMTSVSSIVFRAYIEAYIYLGRGRDPSCLGPPAQIRTGAISSYGSYLGSWRQTAAQARDGGCGRAGATWRCASACDPN
jgi:hypothetical protein